MTRRGAVIAALLAPFGQVLERPNVGGKPTFIRFIMPKSDCALEVIYGDETIRLSSEEVMAALREKDCMCVKPSGGTKPSDYVKPPGNYLAK